MCLDTASPCYLSVYYEHMPTLSALNLVISNGTSARLHWLLSVVQKLQDWQTFSEVSKLWPWPWTVIQSFQDLFMTIHHRSKFGRKGIVSSKDTAESHVLFIWASPFFNLHHPNPTSLLALHNLQPPAFILWRLGSSWRTQLLFYIF